MELHVRTDNTRRAGRAGAAAVSRTPASDIAAAHDPILATCEEPP
jgi:hypothetical protein